MALKIRGNQKDHKRYQEIVACILEERRENPPRNHEKVASEKSPAKQIEVQ